MLDEITFEQGLKIIATISKSKARKLGKAYKNKEIGQLDTQISRVKNKYNEATLGAEKEYLKCLISELKDERDTMKATYRLFKNSL